MPPPPARRLLAPVALALFAIGWYVFSAVYIDGANRAVFASGDFAVYVSMDQMRAYLSTAAVLCYITVFSALLIFWYNVVQYARYMESSSNG